MGFIRRDPGPCPVCGAAHTACAPSPRGGILVPQLPARDAGAVTTAPLVDEVAPAPLVAEVVQETLPAGQVTSGTYRRKRTK